MSNEAIKDLLILSYYVFISLSIVSFLSEGNPGKIGEFLFFAALVAYAARPGLQQFFWFPLIFSIGFLAVDFVTKVVLKEE